MAGTQLRSGGIKSCGCMKFSCAEYEIERYLSEKNIAHGKQYMFEDLKSSRNRKLRFDFAIFSPANNELLCLIEYQGQQHFFPTINESFGKVQREETDDLKRIYCKEHNIRLFEITYKESISQRLEEILNEIQYQYANPVPSLESEEGVTTIP